ncbi:MAG: trypsin-like peptidase domain-containing protein [Planctomycetes bacterium]|nr:trypsin-like peptidase domain-containing protein [Planctomycetota bacterium]
MLHNRLSACFALCLAFQALPALDDAARSKARDELKVLGPEIARLSRAFNLIHEVVAPSVVAVHIRANVSVPVGRRGFRLLFAEQEVEVGEGSGFVFRSDDKRSLILTNAHVVLQTNEDQRFVRDARGNPLVHDRLRIELNDGREVDAEFVGGTLESDLAVLSVPLPRLPAVDWADSDRVHVGDWVVALGYPLGVGYSASQGIISATDRSTGVYRSMGGIESFIQTDAAINPGNSGGPLVDIQGRIIGVNSAIKSTTGASIGLGFAIPANLARRIAEDLVDHGAVRWPAIGVNMPPQDLTAEQLAKLGVPPPGGAPVAGVVPASPAAEAGLRSGDFILALNGVRVRNQMQFSARLRACRIGEPVALTLWRGGQEVKAQLVPVGREELERLAQGDGVELAGFGMRLNDDRKPGLLVSWADPEGPAAAAGIKPGDRVLGERTLGALHTEADARQLARRSELVLQLVRDGKGFWARVKR